MCDYVNTQCLYRKELFLVKTKLFIYYVCVFHSRKISRVSIVPLSDLMH